MHHEVSQWPAANRRHETALVCVAPTADSSSHRGVPTKIGRVPGHHPAPLKRAGRVAEEGPHEQPVVHRLQSAALSAPDIAPRLRPPRTRIAEDDPRRSK